MTRRPPTDYYPRVWIADVTKRGHGVFHAYSDVWRQIDSAPGPRRYIRRVRRSCETWWWPHDTALGVLDVPITWAHELGFRPCRKCKWPEWVLRKYGEVVS